MSNENDFKENMLFYRLYALFKGCYLKYMYLNILKYCCRVIKIEHARGTKFRY